MRLEGPTPSDRTPGAPVPPRVLIVSLGALAVAVVWAALPPDVLSDYRTLTWALALIPAFLLAHHRRWHRISVALAAGMALLAFSPILALSLDMPVPDWPFTVLVLSVYIGIALGGGWFSELRSAHAELKRSHEELQQTHLRMIRTNQLDVTGQLAAGVAHEAKNPLTTVLTGVEYLRAYGEVQDPKVRVLLDDMWVAVKRADSVVRGLLDLSREQELFWKEHDLNELVERTLRLVKHDVDRRHIRVVRALGTGLPRVTLDGYRIQQVLINLITNAADAMSEGGTLTLRTSESAVTVGSGPSEAATTGRNRRGPVPGIAIVVEDDGTGIPDEALERIFEPFFTTKGPGEGTGLGLTVARRLVRMHEGTLTLENLPIGARATIRLPLQPEGVQRAGREADTTGG